MMSNAQQIKDLLISLHSILLEQGDTRLTRSIEGLLADLDESDGISKACSTYRLMATHKDGLSDYNIWHPDDGERGRLNEKLDSIRQKLWDAFGL